MKTKASIIGGWFSTAAVTALAVLVPSLVQAASFTSIYTIEAVSDGDYPTGKLTRLDGHYYGTTTYGGAGDFPGGTIFRVDLTTGKEVVVHAFTDGADGSSPLDGLTATAGKLYGTTSQGGSLGGGTVFEFDPATNQERPIYNLPQGTGPSGALVEFRGLLYGTGSQCENDNGCIFSVDPSAGTGQTVFNFPAAANKGSQPSGLIRRGNVLYGTTMAGGDLRDGALFSFNPTTGQEKVEHSFNEGMNGHADGTLPPADALLTVDGILYGTTTTGGDDDKGIVFSFDPDTHHYSILHAFKGADGATPEAGLSDVGGLLYGTTAYGGASSLGVVFSIDPATGQETPVHSFTASEGGGSSARLTEAAGLLYGTVQYGGAYHDGQIYSVDPATGQLAVVHAFTGPPSSFPSTLIKVREDLYGTAAQGGNGQGSIFKVDPKTGVGATVHMFDGADGALPAGPLLDVAGVLYGTTSSGGPNAAGTVFSFNPLNGVLTTLHAFTGGADGAGPSGNLTLVDGALYGVVGGGAHNDGQVFKVEVATGRETRVFSFSAESGYGTEAGLTLANGVLYGAAPEGGADKNGTIYQIDPATGAGTTLYAFAGKSDGARPRGGLLYSNGFLYGATGMARRSPPTVFRFDPATRTKTILHRFKDEPYFGGTFVAFGDQLYDTLDFAPDANFGGVVRVNAKTHAAVLYPANLQAGHNSTASLLRVGRVFYGTSPPIIADNAGQVFSFEP